MPDQQARLASNVSSNSIWCLVVLCPAGLDATAKARHALSLLERLRSALASLSASATAVLQPTADSLAGGSWAIAIACCICCAQQKVPRRSAVLA